MNRPATDHVSPMLSPLSVVRLRRGEKTTGCTRMNTCDGLGSLTISVGTDEHEPIDFTLQVVAIDRAYNESAPQTVHVADDPGGGCAVSSRRRAGGGRAAVVLAALSWAASRTRRRPYRRRRLIITGQEVERAATGDSSDDGDRGGRCVGAC